MFHISNSDIDHSKMAKILIVDDETAILNLMAKACQQGGHETVAAESPVLTQPV